MRVSLLPTGLLSYAVLAFFLTRPLAAQIIPDDTLGSLVDSPGCAPCTITGGTVQGVNLFHSFAKFSIPSGGEANFLESASAPNIENIFSRVTGGNFSNIDGRISTEAANLFLINPAGIIFGQNSALSVNGSFLATTANSISFGDEGQFSVDPLESPSLLTVTAPLGLVFGPEPGAITNRSLEQPPVAGLPPVGLQVPTGETLSLVGGEIDMDGGVLTALSGRVEIGSVAGNSVVGIVGLTPENPALELTYDAVLDFQDINVSNAGAVDVSGDEGTSGDRSGSAQIQGRRLAMTDSSTGIFAFNYGTQKGRDLIIRTSESVELSDFAEIQTVASFAGDAGNISVETQNLSLQGEAAIRTVARNSGDASNISVETQNLSLRGGAAIQTEARNSGDAGNISVETQNLSLRGGATIASFASTTSTGRAGDISVVVVDSIDIAGESSDGEDASPSSIRTVARAGDGGAVTVSAGRLSLQDGGILSASTFGSGQAGDLTVNVPGGVVELRGTAPSKDSGKGPSGLFTQVNEPMNGESIQELGDGGQLTLNTRELIILDGAQISTAARRNGQGGNATITATDSIFISGTTFDATPVSGSSGIFVSAETNSTAAGGNLSITTEQLTVEAGAKISADTLGQGPAGTATLEVDRLILRDGGQIRAGSLLGVNFDSTERGAGGTLTVNAAESIDIFGVGTIGNDHTPVRSALVTQAEGTGNAGRLQVSTPRLTLQDGGQITADSSAEGAAGNLDLVVTDALEMRGDFTDSDRSADIRTASEQSSGGAITITGGGDVLLTGDSDIRTNVASGDGGGGNILIQANSIIALDDSDILAFARGGAGGDIILDAPTFFAENFQPAPPGIDPETLDGNEVVDINASGAIAGVITLPDNTFIENELAELPARFINPDALVASTCVVRSQATGQFIITGSGSLPERPGEASILPYPTGGIRPLPAEGSTEADDSVLWRRGDPIVEPQGAYPLTDGRLVLSRECEG